MPHQADDLAQASFEFLLDLDIGAEPGIKFGDDILIQRALFTEDIGVPGQLVYVVSGPAQFGTDAIEQRHEFPCVNNDTGGVMQHPAFNDLRTVKPQLFFHRLKLL